jgi:O-6-methylguanine DNA methyltransferase
LRKGPPGSTVSYRELAEAAGSPAASRAVGQAMARNPFPIVVPCHRVLGADGSAVGFSAYGGCDLKQKLLEMEGAELDESFERQFDKQKLRAPKSLSVTVKTKTAAKSSKPFKKDVSPIAAEPVKSRRERKHLGEPSLPRKSKLPFDTKLALLHLSKSDKQMARLIDQVGALRLELDEMLTPFETLAESIVYQQLTGKAAATIFGRVKALYGGTLPAPLKVANTPEEKLRACGLSRAKTAALQDLGAKAHAGLIPTLQQLEAMDNDEIIERLTMVRGIGRWTVEMLLMFRLGRPDVLPINDYGVRKGFALTYGRKDNLPTPKELEAHGERWRPYRTIASWYLWRSLDKR